VEGIVAEPMLVRPERSQLKDQVYQELKQAIVDLRLEPGQPLREATLSAQLGVSKTPVREALVRLQEEGLVTIEPYRGATVSGYAYDDLVEIYELRELLEGACARSAAASMSAAAQADLQQIVKASAAALKSRKADRQGVLTQLFDDFDECLLRQMANGRIRGLLENLRCHVVRIGRLTVDIPGRLEQSVAQHAEIAEAIRRHDADASEAAMRRHVRSVREDQLSALGRAS
jgi:DNA-binding GntR family transcriptional regulator